ncbi:hypothetical protein [Kibdelosporangium aridum]|uniref:Nucleotidyltransferase domain-containing protein n=1 Tax=Kibdelosporangium aridum TaxID=2030 RepID=A0A1W2E9F2_KIBAR|nr:hypothetical protein [Kibdelosporangium aridum]SMD06384.1 hypothetical protein SAMN05661093_04093 [Kibdelosporangium aridum]
MQVGEARAIAQHWTTTQGIHLRGFAGAFLQGSVLWTPPEAQHPRDSDVDIMVVVDSDDLPPAPGKFWHDGILLEASVMRAAQLRSPEAVLRDYHLAGNMHLPGILADPTGHLSTLHAAVAQHFADERWVLARCDDAMNRVRRWLTSMDPSAPLPDQVTSWLFGTGVMTHVLLVAGLRNPTVRRRYAAVRDLLQRNERLDYHETLLTHLGAVDLTATQVKEHLQALAKVFDAAKTVEAPYRFSSDITVVARPIAIDGARDLITAGLHREAMFWIVATYCRCLTKLSLPGLATTPYDASFNTLLADLGVQTPEDRQQKATEALAALPELWNVALVLRKNTKQHNP